MFFFNAWIRSILCGAFAYSFSMCLDFEYEHLPAIKLRGAQIQGRLSKVCHAERATETEASPIFTGFWEWGGYGWFFFSKMMLFSFGDPKSILTWPCNCRWIISQHFFKMSPTKITHTMTLDFGLWILRYISFYFDIFEAGGNFEVCLT